MALNDDLMRLPPYGLAQPEKDALYARLLSELMEHHRKACPAYGRILAAAGKTAAEYPVEQLPFLPVSLFKERLLTSIPEEECCNTITSSGTTGQRPSVITLDRQTALRQQQALVGIVSDFIGPQRLPCLMLDSRTVLSGRSRFSARAAGVRGFSIFGKRVCWALDENMELDLETVRQFAEAYRSQPVLLFGFTYLIWSKVVLALEQAGLAFDLSQGTLIHGGGWKKLHQQAVSPQEFKERVRGVLGVRQVLDYYGMAEQTGSIFMECECGHLHASVWSEVLVRRSSDYSLCEPGEPGILQVLSPLAESYPGFSLLTEDQGVLLGVDDCPCGRKGRYFRVMGRVPRAEVRGCSDTYEG